MTKTEVLAAFIWLSYNEAQVAEGQEYNLEFSQQPVQQQQQQQQQKKGGGGGCKKDLSKTTTTTKQQQPCCKKDLSQLKLLQTIFSSGLLLLNLVGLNTIICISHQHTCHLFACQPINKASNQPPALCLPLENTTPAAVTTTN